MSNYCPTHPSYCAARKPKNLCARCWQLYFFFKNPEREKEDDKKELKGLIELGWFGDLTEEDSNDKGDENQSLS